MAKNITVSIIIVHYKVSKELFDCLLSIEKSKINVPYEIIVVDNDEKPTIQKTLQKHFSHARYIQNEKNVGYGAGNNIGTKAAKGEFIFFLNPDTIVQKNTIDILVRFIEREKNIGIVAPLFLDSKNKPYPLQGSATLTPFRAIMCLSFVQKLFPNNPIYRAYYLFDWNKNVVKQVDVAPGTAFLIRKKIFQEVGLFDERFFLFFEENDLCMRVKKLGYKIYITPSAKVMHLWGGSTEKLTGTKQVFQRSRFLYFKKHYGALWARIVEVFCR